ncbi:hypothetical protein OSB04_031364 [Centaurea solstitialis]|uniref:Uncharacterized protein n=1 Tax=Centaurea solstitialis TaxID=347529 RepID=A0AA38SLI7_9ASTR|nr:hypothetical protein OSB04_031364 [Centaurea solstitialis]
MVGLQESKLSTIEDRFVKYMWGSEDVDFVFKKSTGRLGGLITMWNKNEFSKSYSIEGEGFLAVFGHWSGIDGLMGCVNIYGPSGEREKLQLWGRLCTFLHNKEVRWCLWGDFNEGKKYTRVNDDGRKFSKLDRFLVSDSFYESWKTLGVITLDRKLSYHCPIMLADKSLNFGPIPIHFFDAWLEEKDVDLVVKEAWSKPVTSHDPNKRLRDKLKAVKIALRKWSQERFGSLDSQLEVKRQKVEDWERAAEGRVLDANELEEWKTT